ncbi:MAG: trypsin-like peptidase domain-containing protein [Phycisphaerales bacterium]|nr:trypsin-like peptidase domain-containing protein [Phycisphaerales bacterium]
MTSRLIVALSLCAGLMAAAPAMSQPAPTAYEVLATTHAKAMVNVKFTSKFGAEEEEGEVPGVIIDKGGLVLVSNDNLRGINARFGAPGAESANIKVLVGEDTEGVDAKVIARDSELGLAWVQIEKAAEGGYAFVDFEAGAESRAGERVMVISQLSKFFDRATVVTEGVVAGVTVRPRRTLIPSLELATTEWGVPVFDANAKPVGLMTIILPEKEELESMPGGPGEVLKGIPGGKIVLPAAEVAAATKRAREAAASGQGEPAAPVAPATPPGEAPAAPGSGEGAPK